MSVYRIDNKKDFDLKDFDPDDIQLWPNGKKEAKEKTKELRNELISLQRLLHAQGKQKL